MARVAGVELKYAIKKAVTWGTAVTAVAGDGLLCLAPTIQKTTDVMIDDSLGQFCSKDGTPGPIKVEGELPMYARYDGLDVLMAMVMGTAGVPSTHAAGTISKDYVYNFADNTDGYFVTFARHRKNYVEEVPSLKIAGVTIKGEVGQPVQVIFKVIGNNTVQDVVNTTSTFNSVTITEVANRLQFGQAVFRLNAQAGGALATPADVVKPTSFELSVMRKLSGVYGSYTTGVAGNMQDVIDEPTNDGRPEISLKLGFPQHTSKTSLTEFTNDTRKKGDITFTGAIIEGAIPKLFKMEFPNLQYKDVGVQDEQGIIKEPIEFICHGVNTAPTGMATLLAPVRISGTNIRATNPLA